MTTAERPAGHAAAVWRAARESEVCICGLGARTPLGLDAASTAAAVRAGVSALSSDSGFIDKVGAPISLARDSLLGADVPVDQRLRELLVWAVAEATTGLDGTTPLTCVFAAPEPRPGLDDNLQDLFLAMFRHTAFARRVEAFQVLAYGHAAGLMAMQWAAQRIAAGESELCLVAGADSYHDGQTLRWLDQHGRLMSAENRNGFPPGEAGAACLLASARAARRLGLPVLGHVAAAATAVEPVPFDSDAPCTGLGLSSVVHGIASGLELPAQAITATYCDLNGERRRNEEFGYTLLRTQEAFLDAHDYSCPADCWGDVGSASGPLYAMLAIVAAHRGYAKGSRPLLWAGSDGGHRSAVLLSGVEALQARA
jgi:3-oxoacyl-[acyl-carrier-protein] synthase-1